MQKVMGTGNHNKKTAITSGTSSLQYIIAVALLVGYGFFIYYLVGRVDSGDPAWSRLIYLFSGVEAIVFAAVGFLFGKEVNRRRAEQAEIGKKEEEKLKEAAREQAVEERKKALILGAMAIQAEQGESPRNASDGTAMESVGVGNPAAASMAARARKMYPELDNRY
ncbi:hypothetical protein [Pseudozobellia thermophila]|uniref:Uncharacterized protein n=1 Tax=Pseudozobellia thermophila TaxID=192903 RepID=A0A1M6M7G3_9FLAO|nr:hypothetical protein [Pseudozobellia thermophila]SHJ79395.1 hypothetical protein SAMN04488513_10925 [Pseudozobellia thermophila]